MESDPPAVDTSKPVPATFDARKQWPGCVGMRLHAERVREREREKEREDNELNVPRPLFAHTCRHAFGGTTAQ